MGYANEFVKSAIYRFRKDSIFIFVVIFYFILVNSKYDMSLLAFSEKVRMSILSINFLFVLSYGVYAAYDFIFVTKPDYPIRILFTKFVKFIYSPKIFANYIVVTLYLAVFINVFWLGKLHIAVLGDQNWDKTLFEIDSFIHLGNILANILFGLIGNWIVLFLINVNYQIWMIVQWAFVLYFFFFEKNESARMRYIIAFMGTWIICGTILANLMPSGGPCYYGYLVQGENPFAGLMASLRDIHENKIWLPAIYVQDMLWAGKTGVSDKNFGISAMPSLHNGVVLMNVLALWNMSKTLFRLHLFHAVLVFIGSIVLGWHYAIDAYVSWVAVALIWAFATLVSKYVSRIQAAPVASHDAN